MALIVTIEDIPAVPGMKPLELVWLPPQRIAVGGVEADFGALPEGAEFPFQVWDEAEQKDVLTMPEWSPYLRSSIARRNGDLHFTLFRPVWPGAVDAPPIIKMDKPGRAFFPHPGDINAIQS